MKEDSLDVGQAFAQIKDTLDRIILREELAIKEQRTEIEYIKDDIRDIKTELKSIKNKEPTLSKKTIILIMGITLAIQNVIGLFAPVVSQAEKLPPPISRSKD